MKYILFLTLLLSFSGRATEWIYVNDASKLLWQMNSAGTVWFRNLDKFNENQSGCCYAYKMDTTTAGGKSLWSTILAKMASKESITLGFPQIGTNASPQSLSAIGKH